MDVTPTMPHKDRLSISVPILVLGLLSSACTHFARHPRSGYFSDSTTQVEIQQFYQDRTHHERQLVVEELGLQGKPVNPEDTQAVQNRLRLKRLESRLESQRDLHQYYQIKGALFNDQERIYFLSLPTWEARESYIRNRGLNSNQDDHPDHIVDLIEKNDIALGMTQKAVTESWGDPDLVEIAGNPVYGHAAWRYSRFVSDGDGFNRQTRIVYFENGRVVGWQTL